MYDQIFGLKKSLTFLAGVGKACGARVPLEGKVDLKEGINWGLESYGNHYFRNRIKMLPTFSVPPYVISGGHNVDPGLKRFMTVRTPTS